MTDQNINLTIDVSPELLEVLKGMDTGGGNGDNGNGNGQPPTDPTADYDDPLHAQRIGYRRVVFKEDFRTHVGTKNQKGEWKRNKKGALLVSQDGRKFYKGDVAYCWFFGVDVDPGSKAWEICDIPGNLIIRRSDKVMWAIEDGIEYWLPE